MKYKSGDKIVINNKSILPFPELHETQDQYGYIIIKDTYISVNNEREYYKFVGSEKGWQDFENESELYRVWRSKKT
jgi:hypothetical protein